MPQIHEAVCTKALWLEGIRNVEGAENQQHDRKETEVADG